MFYSEITNQAYRRTIARQVSFSDEINGSAHLTALTKAANEIDENKTIEFSGDVLRFTSRRSGKQRIVTKSGCHQTCDCKGKVAYHQAMFQILTAYLEIEIELAAPLPQISTEELHANIYRYGQIEGAAEARVARIEADMKADAEMLAELSGGNCKSKSLDEHNSPYFSGGNRTERRSERVGNCRI